MVMVNVIAPSSSSETPEADDLARFPRGVLLARVGLLGPTDPEIAKAAKVSGQGPTYEVKVAGVTVNIVSLAPRPTMNL